MKTDALIDLMARDATRRPPLGRSAAIALVFALIVAWAVMLFWLGIRPDVASALQTPRYLFKFVVTGGLVLSAAWLAVRIGRPGARISAPLAALLTTAILLIGSVLVELAVLPASAWKAQMVGTNSLFCLRIIPLLSIAPLAVFLAFMRQAAPSSGALAGAVCGLAAGAAAATAYAAHCPDDSPLFVAVWYMLAILIVAVAGALIGSRTLRW